VKPTLYNFLWHPGLTPSSPELSLVFSKSPDPCRQRLEYRSHKPAERDINPTEVRYLAYRPTPTNNYIFEASPRFPDHRDKRHHDYQHMSNRASRDTSPATASLRTESKATSTTPRSPKEQDPTSDVVAATHRAESQDTSSTNLSTNRPDSYPDEPGVPGSSGPLIVVTGSYSASATEKPDRASSSSHQAQNIEYTPSQSLTPSNSGQSQSDPRSREESPAAMSSSGSSPGNTSTSGSTSGTTSSSNPAYHLPYAPFPYPMPRGGQGTQGGSSNNSGK
jgi:hypothetical protein